MPKKKSEFEKNAMKTLDYMKIFEPIEPKGLTLDEQEQNIVDQVNEYILEYPDYELEIVHFELIKKDFPPYIAKLWVAFRETDRVKK